MYKYMYNQIEVKNKVCSFPTSSHLVLDVIENCFILDIDFLKWNSKHGFDKYSIHQKVCVWP